MKAPIPSCAIILTLSLGAVNVVYADSAAWNANPVDNNWSNPANWTPNTVPNGPTDTATFGVSDITDVNVIHKIELDAMIFQAGASPYTFSISGLNNGFTFSGSGLINNSGQVQALVLPNFEDHLSFRNSATAGNQTTINGGGGTLGGISFHNNSSAGSCTFTLAHCVIDFYDNSTAGDGVFIAGGFDQAPGTVDEIIFHDESSAGNGYFVLNGATSFYLDNSGFVDIEDNATADNATFINMPASVAGAGRGSTTIYGSGGNGTFVATGSSVPGAAAGSVAMFGGDEGSGSYTASGGTNGGDGGSLSCSPLANGGTARFIVSGNGYLSLGAGLTIGSLEGDGLVLLGGSTLITGSNDLSTTFSGVIQDTGELTKIGNGTLTLSGANTYTGGTTVTAGALKVSNASGSGTGTGAVQVSAGTLGGSGIIAGAATIGTGIGAGAFLAPAAGTNVPATLTIQSALTFNADATYTYTFKKNRNGTRTDQVIASGVTINSGAMIALSGHTSTALRQGRVLTLISNTSVNPISGTFGNLPDGGIVTVNGNNLQASYSGGDGNDLTLTVVP